MSFWRFFALSDRETLRTEADVLFPCSYFIKDGAVSEAGTHDELLALRGGYYEYVQLQALSKK